MNTTAQNPQIVYVAPPQESSTATQLTGLAWTALILGIIGLAGSLIPFLNVVTAIAAVVGLVLGLIAVFGGRKLLAAIGIVLCLGGVVASVAMTGEAVNQINHSIESAP